MRKYYLNIFFLFLASFAIGQIQPEFRVGNEEYRPLQNATVLTTPAQPGDFWDDLCYEVILTQPVNLGVFNQTLTIMEICSDGRITFYNAAKTNFYTVAPFQAEYIDKRIDPSLLEVSDILYKTEAGFTTVEFRNVASRFEFGWYGEVNSSFTFQMRIDHSTGNIKYNYGESVYSQVMWDLLNQLNEVARGGMNVRVGNQHFAWVLSGSTSNISFVYVPMFNGNNFPSNRLREIPVDGTNIEFIWETGSSVRTENTAIPGKVFPNPSEGLLNLEFDGNAGELMVFDQWGRAVHNTARLASGTAINLHHLPSGLYHIRLSSPDGVLQRVWKKI
jgi:hypothetical protein